MSFDFESVKNIPRKLRERNRWVLRDHNKVPHQPRKSGALVMAKANDPTTWSSLADCLDFLKTFGQAHAGLGLGYQLGDGDVGLDLDHVTDPYTREILCPITKDILEEIDGIGYAEHSPNDGIHIIFTDVNPRLIGKYLKKKDLGSGRAIEMYFEKRYFTITGNTKGFEDWDIGHVCDPAVEYVGENYLAKKEFEQQSKTATVSSSLEKVLKGYCAHIITTHRQEEGDRDNWLYRAVSGVADRSNRDYSTCLHWAIEFNRVCCNPPLQQSDCERIARSACDNSEVRHIELKPLEGLEPMHDEDELLEASTEAYFSDLISSQHKFDLRTFYNEDGYIGEFMRQCRNDTQQDHHELDFASAISSLAAILSTRVTLMGETSPNLLTVALAPSGTGKEYGRKLSKSVLRQAGFDNLIGKDKVSSGQGLYAILAERPQALFCLDEFADTLGDNTKASPIMTGIAEALKMSYSANGATIEPAAKVDKSFNTVIENCAPSYYLTTTPQAWWNSFRLENAADGVLGRIMYFESPKRKLRKKAGGFSFLYKSGSTISQRLITIAEQWKSGVSDLQVLMNSQDKINWGCSQEAIDMFHEFRYTVNERSVTNGDHTSPLWDRCFDKICKLALIFSCSRLGAFADVKEVSAGDMLLAIKVVKSQTYLVSHKLTTELADNYIAKLANRIAGHLRTAREPLTKGALASLGVKVPDRDFRQAIEILESQKAVAIVPAKRGSKDAYLAIEHYSEWKSAN